MLGIAPRVMDLLDNNYTTELYLQPTVLTLNEEGREGAGPVSAVICNLNL